jgi:methionyl-tRNA formyltransferase
MLHHRHFVRAVQAAMPIARVFVETAPRAPAGFETTHPFETARDRHESETWFGGAPPSLDGLAPSESFPNLNAPEAVRAIAAAKPDALVVFGTGRLNEAVIGLCPNAAVNLHGGNPEDYRGLDTHLWAIYHGDFPALVTTLHRLAPTLDSGDVIQTLPLPLARGMALYELRRINTEICLRLTLSALEDLARRGQFAGRAQRRAGRYYSFMPAVLKTLCVERFARHTERL